MHLTLLPPDLRKETIANRMAAIKAAVPLTTDQAVIRSSVLMMTALATQMKTTIEAIHAFDQEIEQLCSTHEDYHLCASLPGAGPVYAARLAAAMGTARDRWTTVEELLCFSGVAPVMERRGKATWIRWRSCCPKFLWQSFHEYAGESIHHSFWAKAYDMSQRARGKRYQAAVRALAFKWIRILYKCWQSRTPSSDVRYLEILRKKSSPLWTFAANNPS